MAATERAAATGFLKVRPMAPGQIAQALPLARSARADLTLCEWRAYCKAVLDGAGTGIDCVVDENGYLLGLMVFRRQADLRHGAVLSVAPFIAVDLCGRDTVACRLLARAEDRAAALDCAAVHIARDGVDGLFPRRCGAAFARFLEDGYHADGLRLCKPLPTAG